MKAIRFLPLALALLTAAPAAGQQPSPTERRWINEIAAKADSLRRGLLPNDTGNPTVTLSAPTSGQQVSGTAVRLTATASDAVTGVAFVAFRIDGQNVAVDSVSPYDVTWNSRSVPNGGHSYTATATDRANRTATTTARTIQVNNPATPPPPPPDTTPPPPPPPPPLDTTAVRVDVSPSSGPSVLVGDTLRFSARVFDRTDSVRAYAVTWSSDSTRVASVSASGLARGLAVGRAPIRARVGNVSAVVPLDVRAPAPPPPDPTEPGTCTRTLNGTINGNLVLAAGERACVGADLRVSGNVLVKDAVLQMRAGSSLTILGANPSAYVGGGMEYSAALDGDRGVWVWGSGQLDIACTPKLAWNRTGSDPTWRPTDEYWIAPTAVSDFTVRRWTPGQPIPQVDPRVPATEVFNATRDCAINGPGHIHVHSSKPQRVEYVRLSGLGTPALGRYALHLHLSGDGTRGTTIRGVVAVDSKGRAFVPHASHGVTMIDNVALNTQGDGMWWDEPDLTNDLMIDHMAVCGVGLPSGQSGHHAYELGAGSNMVIRNSVACGVNGNKLASGFDWPEPWTIFQNVLDKMVWGFDTGNVAHNNRGAGARFWNNTGAPHLVADYQSYRNGGGDENGAYKNGNEWRSVVGIENGYVVDGDNSANRACFSWETNGVVNDAGRSPGIAGLYCRALSGDALHIGHRQLTSETPVLFSDCTLIAGPGFAKVVVGEGVRPWVARFTRCNLTPDDIVFENYDGNRGSLIEIVDPTGGGAGWNVTYDGQKRVTPRDDQQQSSAAELPRVRVNTAMPVTTSTVRVTGSLQAALDTVRPGTQLLLAAGSTHVGNFTLPAKSGSGWIVVATDAALPPMGTRLTPQAALGLARILTPNNEPAIATASGAARYRLIGVSIGPSGVDVNGALVKLGSGTTTTPAASDIILDRVFVDGGERDVRRCVELNSAASAVIDSYLAGCHAKGADAQAFLAYNTPGPILLRNNYLEGSGENVMFGGADSRAPNMIPADIEIVGNDIVKPAAWFAANRWTEKNLLELKTATRVLIEGNTFDGSWRDGQTGSAVVMFSVNQDGTAPWSHVSDVTFRRNTIRNAVEGVGLAGRFTSEEPLSRVLVEDTRFEAMGSESAYTQGGGGGRLLVVTNENRNVSIRHNEYRGAGLSNQVIFEGSLPGFVFENNVIGPAEYGFQNAAQLSGVRGNVIAPDVHGWNDPLRPGNCVLWPPVATSCVGAGVR